MFKWIFLVVFVIFVGIRLRYGKTEDTRIQFHHMRELISSTLFTVSLLGTTVLYLSSEPLDSFVLNFPDEIRYLGGLLALGGNGLLLWVHIFPVILILLSICKMNKGFFVRNSLQL